VNTAGGLKWPKILGFLFFFFLFTTTLYIFGMCSRFKNKVLQDFPHTILFGILNNDGATWPHQRPVILESTITKQYIDILPKMSVIFYESYFYSNWLLSTLEVCCFVSSYLPVHFLT
jgi:hypothetical protein